MDAFAQTLIAALVVATLALAWSWLAAEAGIVAFGNAVFFGIGAYAVAVSNERGGSPWYGALGGALLAVALAALCALVCLRGRGIAFMALTLAGGIAAEPLAAASRLVGPHDVYVFARHLGFLNLQFASAWPYLLLAASVFGVAQAVTALLSGSRLGLVLRAVRANPRAARGIGLRAFPARLAALGLTAFVSSVAGSLQAQYWRAVAPHAVFALGFSFDIALVGAIAARLRWAAVPAALVYTLAGQIVDLHPPGFAGAVVLVVEGLAVVTIALRPAGWTALSLGRPAAPALRNAG